MKNNRVFINIETRDLGFYKNGFFTVGENTIQTGCEPSSEFWEEVEDYVLKTEEGFKVFTKALNYYTVSENLEISYSGYFEGIDRMFKIFATKENAEIYIFKNKLKLFVKEIEEKRHSSTRKQLYKLSEYIRDVETTLKHFTDSNDIPYNIFSKSE